MFTDVFGAVEALIVHTDVSGGSSWKATVLSGSATIVVCIWLTLSIFLGPSQAVQTFGSG